MDTVQIISESLFFSYPILTKDKSIAFFLLYCPLDHMAFPYA